MKSAGAQLLRFETLLDSAILTIGLCAVALLLKEAARATRRATGYAKFHVRIKFPSSGCVHAAGSSAGTAWHTRTQSDSENSAHAVRSPVTPPSCGRCTKGPSVYVARYASAFNNEDRAPMQNRTLNVEHDYLLAAELCQDRPAEGTTDGARRFRWHEQCLPLAMAFWEMSVARRDDRREPRRQLLRASPCPAFAC